MHVGLPVDEHTLARPSLAVADVYVFTVTGIPILPYHLIKTMHRGVLVHASCRDLASSNINKFGAHTETNGEAL